MNMVHDMANMKTAPVINYSGRSMSMTECKQLCKDIIRNDQIEEVRFCDCLLSEEIAKCILHALTFSGSVRLADFKGNNFRTKSSENICKLLKQTTCLKELFLEWNALGLHDVGMSAVAEGLAVNKSVEVLDLSNNQICQNGARLLCLALKRNKTLKTLDMRWNNVGVAGGREFLSALQHNKTLVALQLAGNNIPSDTLKAISTSIQRNMDYHSMYQQHVSLTQSLKKEIDNVKHEKNVEVSNLAVELEREKELYESFNTTTQERLEELNKSLGMLSKDKENLTQANAQLESELKAATMKVTYLEESVADLSKCNTDLRKTHEESLQSMEETLTKERKHWQFEVEEKVNEMERLQKDVKSVQVQMEGHLREITSLKNVVRLKGEEIVANEAKHQREKEMMHHESTEQIKNLTDRISRHVKEKEELEEAMSKLKSSMAHHKLKFEEDIASLRSTLKQEETAKVHKYEERINVITCAKDDLQANLSRMMAQEAETHTKLLGYQKDVENLKQLLGQSQETLNTRELEHRKELSNLMADIDTEKREGRNLRGKLDSSEKSVKGLQGELEQLRNLRLSEVSSRDNEIVALRDAVRQKEDEIRRIHQDELNRTNMLESAFQTYIMSARSSKH